MSHGWYAVKQIIHKAQRLPEQDIITNVAQDLLLKDSAGNQLCQFAAGLVIEKQTNRLSQYLNAAIPFRESFEVVLSENKFQMAIGSTSKKDFSLESPVLHVEFDNYSSI